MSGFGISVGGGLDSLLAQDTVAAPYSAFNFAIEITVPGRSDLLCNGAFSECDGLDVNLEVKTIREGGNNGAAIRLAGGVTYGNLTLKRGMTDGTDLWDWIDETVADPSLRADADIVYLASDRSERTRIRVRRCLPIKVKAPALNAKDGMVAVEELVVAYESMSRVGAGGGAGGFGLGVSVGFGGA